ncbi:MAG: DUF1549 domain-containing protein, partial [Armatimonadetes bacterium]|nr:DUF1549 domain-containing protein [Armatimonadota bacterium]
MHRLSYRLFLLTGTLAGSVLIPALASPPHPAGQRLHWAYRPITRVAPPSVRRSDWVRNPIDAFVLARLEREGITPSSAAEREVLFRRVALDLTGLPSSPAELDRALADTSPAAYERWVDRLLASPAYGERWARHWLDLARYSDTDGYGPDRLRPYAWRWRDWVIQSLNEDLPF